MLSILWIKTVIRFILSCRTFRSTHSSHRYGLRSMEVQDYKNNIKRRNASPILFTLLLLWLATTAWAGIKPVKEKSQLPLADPFVLLENNVYYAYGTHSDDGIEVYTSADLHSWKLVGLALDKKNTTQTRWFWAPEVYHIGDLYYMYYSANERLYAATSSSPLGPFVQVGKEFLDEGSIDGSLFCDKGDYYFFFVRFTDGNAIWVARMNDDLCSIRKETLRPCLHVSQEWETDPKFPGCKVNEGPFVLKHKGKYYLTYSANHYQSHLYGVGVATATNPMGPWSKVTSNPVLQKAGGLTGTGHHSFFTDKKGKMQMVFHAHNSMTEIGPRLSYFIPVDFHKNTLKTGRKILVPQLKP